jgi:type IV secretory pathway TraG/TraD family ATPase VirD4
MEVNKMAYDNIILAKGCEYSSNSQETGINNNQIIIGGSGSGKTVSLTEPCLLHTDNRNLIVTVTKRRIVDKYKELLEGRGYDVSVLDFTNVKKSTVGFDPMRFARDEEEILNLARSFVLANPRKNRPNTSDPFWDEAATSFLGALIGHTKLMDSANCTFADVIEKYKKLNISYTGPLITTNYDKSFNELELLHPDSAAAMHWKSFCRLPSRTASCVTSALSSTISYMFSENILGLMRKKEQVDFKKFAQKKSVLFIVSSPVSDALSSLISIFYATAIRELFDFAENQKNGRLPYPTHVICDDFASGARIPDFPQYISIIREKGLSVSLLCQSESQLESMYSNHEATTIINNCDTYVFTGGMDIKTAQSVAMRLNRPIDEVLSLPIGTFVIFRRGDTPRIVQRYPIFDDPLYQRAFSKEPTFERAS